MPILAHEPDVFPPDLLANDAIKAMHWWLMYTKSRLEKQFMRLLVKDEVWHYGPMVPQRRRSPSGRVRVSYMPLFSNYVFVCGETDEARYKAICTGAVVKASEIPDAEELVTDLRQIASLIETGAPMTVESRMVPGQAVRVRSGSFAGYEGKIIRREQETRLLVCVRFMEQGVSVKLEDCQLELIG